MSLSLRLDHFREVGFPISVLFGQFTHYIMLLAVHSISILRTDPEHTLDIWGQTCAWLWQREVKTAVLLELVSREAEGPTDRYSVCDIVYFISPGIGMQRRSPSYPGIQK